QAKCTYCAGTHDTSRCPKERVSCVNCRITHKAWQREVCKTFHSYLEGIQVKRMALLTQTLHIRNAGGGAGPATGPSPRRIHNRHQEKRETTHSPQLHKRALPQMRTWETIVCGNGTKRCHTINTPTWHQRPKGRTH